MRQQTVTTTKTAFGLMAELDALYGARHGGSIVNCRKKILRATATPFSG